MPQINFMKRVLLAIIFILVPSAAYAGSSSVDVSRMAVNGQANRAATERVRVTNTDTIAQVYTFAGSDVIKERMSVNPAQFTLSPGESKDVVVRFRMPEQSLNGHVSLISRDSRSQSPLEVASGINIPVSLNTAQVAGLSVARDSSEAGSVARPGPWHGAVYAIDGILIITAAYLMRRRAVHTRGSGYKISFV